MKIAKAVSTALLATTALGVSAAFAGTNPLNGPSDLFVVVWNPNTST